jgi:hypothetical protein
MRTSQVTQGLGVADKIPTWVVPPADSPAILYRTFFHKDWIIPIAVSFALLFLGRVKNFVAGYTLFRIASDYERLPFPLAPVGAQAATVLAEISRKEETWRWALLQHWCDDWFGIWVLLCRHPDNNWSNNDETFAVDSDPVH